jgi:hypothetical protein
MQMKKIFYSILIASFILFGTNIHSQTFGFGCLGFVGGYGGYTYQQFYATGLNEFVQQFNETKASTLQSDLKEFKYATGYRVGINIFRASFEGGFMVTAKGYYQSLGKKNEVTENIPEGTTNYSFDLDLKNWAIGFDVGINLTAGISWKILDGAVHFNKVKLTNTVNTPGDTEIHKFISDDNVFGYSVGTGFIVYIVEDYISIEGLAGYTGLTIDNMKLEEGTPFPPEPYNNQENVNFIDSGGFTAVVQLNVGFPL